MRQRKVAFVVGINNYPNKVFRDLPSSIADAQVVRDELREEGTKVFYAEDCDVLDFKAEFEKFVNFLRAGDSAILYFAGHGVEFKNMNRLVMSSRNPNGITIWKDSVRLLVLLLEIARKRTRINVVIMNCCRDPVYKHTETTGLRRLNTKKKDNIGIRAVKDTLLSFACAPEDPALDSHGQGKRHQNVASSCVMP